ncbi:FadR/GntR family transcriptional regulator [Paracoccus acridae]|nr:FadR/GntR family transcriptional regulator [Paracoccus acridae]
MTSGKSSVIHLTNKALKDLTLISDQTRTGVMDSVLDSIGLAIASGKYPEGASIPTEPELMEAFGVGRSSVREAIRSLVALGMVETAPRRGTVVNPKSKWSMLSRETMRWIMAGKVHQTELLGAIDEARLIFEPSSAALVARRATRMQIIGIETAFARMEDAAERGDAEAAVSADRQFHLAILQATGNPILEAFDAALDSVLGVLFSVTANHMENFRANLSNHLAVVEAIRRHDPEGAFKAMTDTIGFTTTRMKDAGLIE